MRHARNARKAGDYDWAAFACHQSTEKAIEALFQELHLDAWGHTLSLLSTALPRERQPDAAILERAKELDKHYVPTRYSIGFERGAPVDFYTDGEAESAITAAEAIHDFCRRQIA